jgi:purine nucleosidase
VRDKPQYLIDTDTASDDAVALIIALRENAIDVRAITVVCGNVPLPMGVQNALYVVELCGSVVPVYAGAAQPLRRPLETAQFVHGQDGMGDIGLPLSGRRPAAENAVDAILRVSREAAGALHLVTLGPLTNIALALEEDRSLAERVASCVIMGGASDSVGNVTPVSEYNFWVDPDAAAIVFDSGMSLTMVGWDVSRKYAVISPDEAADLRAIGTPAAHVAVDIQRHVDQHARRTGLAGFDLPDPIAMAVALYPEVATAIARHRVEIETGDGLCRGQSIVDHYSVLGRAANADVVVEASHDAFVRRLRQALQ